MNILSSIRLIFALSALALLPVALIACDTVASDEAVVENPPVDVQQNPPMPQIEERPFIADPQAEIWRPGYWAMSGGFFVWMPGKVIARPSPTAVWASAHWVHHIYGWSFQAGHWE